jgi:hypothetical protein
MRLSIRSLLSAATLGAATTRAAATYQVGAYYLGMWSPQAFDPVDLNFGDQTFYVDEGKDWWMGVRTIHDGNLSAINASDPNWLAHGPAYLEWFTSTPELKRKPAIGYYDVSEDATLEAQIEQATAHGLGFFNFYFYYQAYTNSEEMADALHSFVRVTEGKADAMRFALAICADGWYHSIVRSNIPTVTKLLAESYFALPNYLRTASGSPIVELCDVVGIMEDSQLPTPPASPDWSATGPIATFISALRNASLAATGHFPTILGRFDMANQAYREGLDALVDGGTCVLSWVPDDGDYFQQAASTYATLDSIRTKKPFLPCVANNMDERPRMGVIKNGPATDFAVMSNYTLANFELSLREARRWVDDQSDELSHILTVYAWNEWHEGGIIEPSEAEGDARLAAVQAAFEL